MPVVTEKLKGVSTDTLTARGNGSVVVLSSRPVPCSQVQPTFLTCTRGSALNPNSSNIFLLQEVTHVVFFYWNAACK